MLLIGIICEDLINNSYKPERWRRRRRQLEDHLQDKSWRAGQDVRPEGRGQRARNRKFVN